MLTRNQVVEHSYLELRSYLLEIAATLDRYDRAANADGKGGDPRWERIRRGLEILATPSSEPNRVEKLLLLFSDLHHFVELQAGEDTSRGLRRDPQR